MLWKLLHVSILLGTDFDLMSALRKVEDRYNSIRTLRVDFEQTIRFSTQPMAKRTESGVLYLRKPGKMRWEYSEPPRKLFLSDGKEVYFYNPSANRVERSKLKETEDMRAPLGFLIGKLDFQRDFREYRVQPEAGARRVTALPRNDKAPYKEVQFLLLPNHQIGKLKVLGHDQSIMEFVFVNETLNPPLKDTLFVFEMPADAELVDTVNEPAH